jgi:adenine-specific DNA-methyltransferase
MNGERYNREDPSAVMPASTPDLDPGAVGAALSEALVARLREISLELGHRVSPSRLCRVSRTLLGVADDGARPVQRPEWLPALSSPRSTAPHDYLHLIPEAARRTLGQVVTPQPIARYILRAAGYREDLDIVQRSLCDPACGSGIFLVEAVDTYLAALRRTRVPPDEWYPLAVEHLTGIDIDPLACLFARLNLALLLARPLLLWMHAHPQRNPEPLPVWERDTLDAIASEGKGENLSGPRLTDAVDFVVGNPPYRKLGSISGALRDRFQESLFGHPNAYGMFLHAGIEILRPGGRLGFIIPRSMLSGLYFQNLRSLIERRTHLEEISLLAERKNVFPQVLQGTMILVFRKRAADGGAATGTPVRTGIVRSAAELGNGGPPHVLTSPERVARRLNGTSIWFVSDRERTYSLLDKILGRHPLLGGPAVACPARTGPIVWNRLKPFLRTTEGSGCLPLVWATDVARFRFTFATAGDTRPAYLEETPKTRGLTTSGPSLLVQRVTADEQSRRIVATRTDFGPRRRYFVENHLNVLQPAPLAGIDLRFLLGILSSDVVEFLFRSMNGNTQVSATELNLLPVPRGAFEREIASLAAALEEAAGKGRADLGSELNERVAGAYGLTHGDLGFLQRVLRENPAFRDLPRDH